MLSEGDRVVVTEGIYEGQEGTIMRMDSQYYEVGGLIQPKRPHNVVTRLLTRQEVRKAQ